jgi:hypothetical protein
MAKFTIRHENGEADRQIRKMRNTLKELSSIYELNRQLCAIIDANPTKVDVVNQLVEYLSFNERSV